MLDTCDQLELESPQLFSKRELFSFVPDKGSKRQASTCKSTLIGSRGDARAYDLT